LTLVVLPFGRYGAFSVSAVTGLDFRPQNGVTGHPCHGFLPANFQLCYALPLSTYDQAQDTQTGGHTGETIQNGAPYYYGGSSFTNRNRS